MLPDGCWLYSRTVVDECRVEGSLMGVRGELDIIYREIPVDRKLQPTPSLKKSQPRVAKRCKPRPFRHSVFFLFFFKYVPGAMSAGIEWVSNFRPKNWTKVLFPSEKKKRKSGRAITVEVRYIYKH
jgi:hypothetical protein